MNTDAPNPPATFFGHPRGLATLFFTEMWERFTYYGMRALLVLFLVDAVADGGYGMNDLTATAIYGLYTAAVYVVTLPGGWIADRLVGAQRAVLWGAILIMIGNATLAIPGTPELFYSGLVVIVLGVGLLKPNISAIVAELYPEGGKRRDAGFTLFYMGINVGAWIGPLITAWLAQQYGWRAGFFSAAVGMALGIAQFQLTRRHLGTAGAAPHRPAGDTATGRDWAYVGIGMALAIGLTALGIAGVFDMNARAMAESATWVIVAMAAGYFAYLFLFAGLDATEKKRVFVIVVLFIACALFWSGFEQAGSSLNLFAERYTDRLLFGWEIPAGWFQSLNPVFIILFAPLFSMLWIALANRHFDPAAPAQFAFGLILLGLGFLVMVGAAGVVAGGAQAVPYWLVLTYLLHTFGELCLSPVGLSTMTKLAPQRFVGQMMGIWFLATSLGNLFAGLIAGDVSDVGINEMPGQFMNIFWFGLVCGVVLLLFSRPVKNLMGGVR
ncbi:MAG: peptide MFS transporter [Gammaproteobacteria bacterium]